MKKIILILFFLFLNSHPTIFAQEQNELTNNLSDQIVVEPVTSEDVDNQQINKDEGYGAEDEEYYGSEELNSDSNVIENNEVEN